MRRLLLLALLALGAVLATAVPASACEQPAGPLPADLAAAGTVFTGTITQVQASSGAQAGQTAYSVNVTRVYKGTVAPVTTVFAPSTVAACGLPSAAAGQTWLFVSTTTGADLVARSFEGSTRVTDAVTRQLTAELGSGTPPAAAPPPAAEQEVTLTRVADDGPTGFWPLALPGAALVLGGIVVLVAARSLGRQRA